MAPVGRHEEREVTERECPWLGREVEVVWDAFDQSWNGRRGVVKSGAFSSIVGWAITVAFDDGKRRSFGEHQLRLADTREGPDE